MLLVGAANAIGGRLAEALCDRGIRVVALVDDWTRVARLARLPFSFIEGSVTDAQAVGRAMVGCEVVFHCAEFDEPVQTGGMRDAVKTVWHRATFAARRRARASARALLSAAVGSAVRRVVWVSASAVPAPRFLRARDVPMTVLRPAAVYGPFCPWTIDTVRAVRGGRRPRAGRGACVYVDHLVEAVLLAARTDAGAGQVFRLHDAEPASCDELRDAHARAAGGHRTPLSAARPVQTRDADANIRRARDVLGYAPKSTFAENMERTAAWIEWSRP